MQLPNGWKEVKLGDVAKVTSGGTPLRSVAEYWNGNVPWVKTAQIQNSHIALSQVDEYITELGVSESSAKIIPAGTLLMAMYGQGKTRGQVAILDFPAAINQACAAFNLDKTQVVRDYLYQYFLFSYEDLRAVSNSGGQQNLSADLIKKFAVTLPPLEEQKKIAETLSVWDSAIEKMEKLIEQKEKSLEVHLYKCYKNLLNGKKVSLGSLFDKEIFVEKGVNILKAEATDDGSVPVVGAGQTYTCYHHKCTHSFPTITISSSGAYAGYVWFHSIPIWASDCSVLYTKTMDIRYLYYFLKSKQQDIYKLQVGGAQPHVYAKDLKKMLIPDVDETIQKSVVIVFQQIELELSLLKQQLALYKKQKQGLMQKLLTGEWRVK